MPAFVALCAISFERIKIGSEDARFAINWLSETRKAFQLCGLNFLTYILNFGFTVNFPRKREIYKKSIGSKFDNAVANEAPHIPLLKPRRRRGSKHAMFKMAEVT